MKKPIKILVRLVGLVLVLVLLAILSIPVLDNSLYRNLITQKVSAVLGRDLAVDELSVVLLPDLAVSLRGTRFANADWGEEPDLAVIEELDCRLDLSSLLSGGIDVAVALTGFDVLVEKNEQGELNVMLGGEEVDSTDEAVEVEEDEDPSAAEPSRFHIAGVRTVLADGRVRYVDSGQDLEREVLITVLSVGYDGQTIQLEVAGIANDVDVDLAGDIQVDRPASPDQPLELVGAVHFNRLNYRPRPVEPAADEEGAGEEITGEEADPEESDALEVAEAGTSTADGEEMQDPSSGERLIPDAPLDFSFLHAARVDLGITGDELTLPRLDLQGVNISVTLGDGRLETTLTVEQVGTGTIQAEVVLDVTGERPDIQANLALDQCTLSDSGGEATLMLDLHGRGASPAALAGSLDGFVMMHMKDFQIRQSFVTRFGKDLLASINPIDENDEFSRVECGVVAMDIEEGVVNSENRIALQLEESTYFGDLTLDLKDETIDAGFKIRPREGLGISAGALASLVHIGGTLKDPKVRLNPKDVAVKYGSYAAGVATGGISTAAEFLWNRMKANADVCEDILVVFNEDLAKRGLRELDIEELVADDEDEAAKEPEEAEEEDAFSTGEAVEQEDSSA